VRRRILFVNPVGQIGGAERSLLDLLAGLDRHRFEPLAICFASGPLVSALSELDVPVTVMQVNRSLLDLSFRGRRRSMAASALLALQTAAPVIRLAKLMSRQRIALVHTNGIKAQLIAGAAARLSGRPVIWHLRDILGRGRQEQLMLRVGGRCADVIVANSEATRRAVEDRVRCGTVTVHNGVDIDRFRPDVDGAAIRRELGVPDDVPLVGMVGMLAPWKGQDVFLRAACRISERVPEARFVIVGDEIYTTNGHGKHRADLQQLAAELNLGSRVIFTGYRDDMPAVMASLDVLVHASVEAEPFGRVLIEAMASGKPVIATIGGGTSEIVTDGETGALVSPGSPDAIAQALERLLAERELGVAMGSRGRECVEQRFTVRQHVCAIERAYESAMGAIR
jgi:glycosyltransferase involved in cell wall biosynthesis